MRKKLSRFLRGVFRKKKTIILMFFLMLLLYILFRVLVATDSEEGAYINLIIAAFETIFFTVFGIFIYSTKSAIFEEKKRANYTYENVNDLMSKYPNNYIKYNESEFPIVTLYEKDDNKEVRIYIKDYGNDYKLPTLIENNIDTILKSYSYSDIFNSRTLRINSVTKNDNKIIIKVGRTTYFNTLFTNRIPNLKLYGNTVQEYLEPQPYINDLENSLASNQLGFNIFVRTNDKQIVFMKRSKYVSKDKNTYAASVSGGLKLSLCELGSDKVVGICNIEKAITSEINDELNIECPDSNESSSNHTFEFRINEHLISIYRDMTELGKPHFLGFMDIKLSFSELLECVKSNKNKDTDGDVIIGYTFKELRDNFNSKIDEPFFMHKQKMGYSQKSLIPILLTYLQEKDS